MASIDVIEACAQVLSKAKSYIDTKFGNLSSSKADLVGGKVPASQLPSYVDDVIECYYYADTGNMHKVGEDNPITGERGKLYLDINTEIMYRWTGSIYKAVSDFSGSYNDLTDTPDIPDELAWSNGSLGLLANSEVVSTVTPSTANAKFNGLMSTTMYTKLSNIADNANNYSHPTHTAKSAGLYKVTINSLGHVTAATAVTKEDITDLGIPSTNTTYSAATTSANGLMTSAMVKKLNGIATGATKNVVDTSANSSSTNAVSNKAMCEHVASAIKVDETALNTALDAVISAS